MSRRKEILGRPKAAVGLSVSTVKGAWFESEANRYGNRRCKSRNWSGFAPREIDLDIGHRFGLGGFGLAVGAELVLLIEAVFVLTARG